MSSTAFDIHSDRIPLTRPRPGGTPAMKARVKRQATSSYLGSAAAGAENTPKRFAHEVDGLDDGGDERVLLNVGGVRHETHVSTLRTIPNSRLSRLAEVHLDNGGGRQEYFFDRHPAVFNSIIDFYRTENTVDPSVSDINQEICQPIKFSLFKSSPI
nr:potassium voltage-gated channel protein Shaw-like [Biomphalaria glabrata]